MPGGRPKGSKTKKCDLEHAYEFALRGKVDMALSVIDRALKDRDVRVALTAAQDVMDRAWGRATAKTDLKAEVSGGVDVNIQLIPGRLDECAPK